MCGVCACLASRSDEWGESHGGTIERSARVRKRIRLIVLPSEARRKSHGARRDAFSRHPRAEQPGSDAPSTRGAGRAGLGAFGGDAAASCGRVARAFASPRVPGFAFVGGMGGHAPASDDFIVILADAFAGKNALLPATAPLLAAARPMRAAVTPRPEPDTARLAMDMQREADIVDVRCRWNGRRARSERDQNPKTPPRDKKMKRLERTRSLVPKPIRFRYQQSAKQTVNF